MLYLFYQEEMPNRLPLILFINLPLLRFTPRHSLEKLTRSYSSRMGYD